MDFKTGDWVIFDLSIGQIMRMDDFEEFSDGSFRTSGRLKDRFRPLTLRNKSTVEYFDHYYSKLREIDGEAGFNYPDISQYFAQLALNSMDGPEGAKEPYEMAQQFVKDARDYKNPIQGVPLFRQKLGGVRR